MTKYVTRFVDDKKKAIFANRTTIMACLLRLNFIFDNHSHYVPYEWLK